MSPPWCLRSHLHMRLCSFGQVECVLRGETWQEPEKPVRPPVCSMCGGVCRSLPSAMSPGWAGGKSEAEWPALIAPPLPLSLAQSLQGCQSPAQPTGSRLEPWRRDQTAIPHLNASLLLLIGGNCLPDARALVGLLWRGVLVVVVVWQQGQDD